MKKVKLNKRDLVALTILACIVLTAFIYALNKTQKERKFASQMENLYAKNENPVFSLDKIIMYSSANAIDNSEGKTLQDLDIYQYTDIAIYIDNFENLDDLVKESAAMNASTVNTDDEASRKIKEHTVKELYIDNIKINTNSNKGKKTLLYKNHDSFGKFKVTEKSKEGDNQSKEQDTSWEENNLINLEKQPDRIDFDIVATNEENEKSDYSKPTFYADCSNPITLGYMNKDILTDYAVSTENTQIKFDGSILKSVGIDLEDIACYITFDIHMKNNLEQRFISSVEINVPLKSETRSIYDGFMYSMDNELQNKYKFFKF